MIYLTNREENILNSMFNALKTFKNPAKRMKEQIKNIEKDINIVIEAINNGDTKDAVSMLKDIQEDLKVIALVSE